MKKLLLVLILLLGSGKLSAVRELSLEFSNQSDTPLGVFLYDTTFGGPNKLPWLQLKIIFPYEHKKVWKNRSYGEEPPFIYITTSLGVFKIGRVAGNRTPSGTEQFLLLEHYIKDGTQSSLWESATAPLDSSIKEIKQLPLRLNDSNDILVMVNPDGSVDMTQWISRKSP